MDTDLLSLNSNNFDFDDYLDSGFKMTDEFDRQNKKARMHKKSRNLNHINFDLSNSNSNTTSSDTGNAEFSTDPNEPRYCICNNVSYGLMICCENKQVKVVSIVTCDYCFVCFAVSIQSVVPSRVCWN